MRYCFRAGMATCARLACAGLCSCDLYTREAALVLSAGAVLLGWCALYQRISANSPRCRDTVRRILWARNAPWRRRVPQRGCSGRGLSVASLDSSLSAPLRVVQSICLSASQPARALPMLGKSSALAEPAVISCYTRPCNGTFLEILDQSLRLTLLPSLSTTSSSGEAIPWPIGRNAQLDVRARLISSKRD